MWKIMSLFTLLVLAEAANIDDIYGDWWEVAFYPVSTPVCIQIRFAKSTNGVNCTYADGRNATLVLGTMMTADKGLILHRQYVPMMMVDTPTEVMPALNISVKCDGLDKRERAVVRMVNEDYFILYANIPAPKKHRSEIEQNSAILFGRNLVSSEQLGTVMMSIEDLKNRRRTEVCVTENYDEFKSTGNEIKNLVP